MKKVMVLGAGRGQVPIIDICHKYNCYVITVSPKGDYPGLYVSDKVYYFDVTDKETIYMIAKNEQIDAVLTDQLDEGVLTAAYISEKLGINGISYNVALKFTNKQIMRESADKLGVSIPYSFIVSSLEDAIKKLNTEKKVSYPFMIKPVDSSASRGVFKIRSEIELREKFDISMSYSSSGFVIIENYISGQEFVVEAYTKNHITNNLIIGHRDYFSIPDTFIPSATVFIDANSIDNEIESRIAKINKELVQGFGLNFGITHAEFLYDKKNDIIYLVEIAARGGGVFISSDLIPSACGINALELLVKDCLNIAYEENFSLKKGASGYFCYLLPEGKVITLEGTSEVDKIDGILKSFFDNIAIGINAGPIIDKSSRKGPILVSGISKDNCYSVIEEVKKVLKIRVVNNNKVLDAIWN